MHKSSSSECFYTVYRHISKTMNISYLNNTFLIIELHLVINFYIQHCFAGRVINTNRVLCGFLDECSGNMTF